MRGLNLRWRPIVSVLTMLLVILLVIFWVDMQDERSSTTTRLKGDAYKFFHLPRDFKCTRLDARGGMQADVRRTFEQHVERREPVILQLGDALFDASNGFRWRKWMATEAYRAKNLRPRCGWEILACRAYRERISTHFTTCSSC